VDRRHNVAGAFVATGAPEHVVLVDDVYTSGATVHAAATALRRAGAREVDVVTFARAIRRG
jgi:predicted amidophosphoribosyltransferase